MTQISCKAVKTLEGLERALSIENLKKLGIKTVDRGFVKGKADPIDLFSLESSGEKLAYKKILDTVYSSTTCKGDATYRRFLFDVFKYLDDNVDMLYMECKGRLKYGTDEFLGIQTIYQSLCFAAKQMFPSEKIVTRVGKELEYPLKEEIEMICDRPGNLEWAFRITEE